MKFRKFLVVLGIMGIFSIVPCLAQEEINKDAMERPPGAMTLSKNTVEFKRDKAKFERMMVISKNLELSPREQEKFWQEYGRYQDRLETLRDRAVKLIITYNSKLDAITGEEAKQMLNELLDIQQDEMAILREFLPRFEAILPLKKMVRFYQLDNKINAEIRYKLSLGTPLLETQEETGK